MSGSQFVDGGDRDDGHAGFVGGAEVDLRADSPVVVTGRIVEDLPYEPAAWERPGASVCGLVGLSNSARS